MKWRIVGFKHPADQHSLIYREVLNNADLIQALRTGIERGCNLFSIRGFEEEETGQAKL